MEAAPLRASRFGLGLKLALFVTALVLAVSAALAYFLIQQAASARQLELERRVSSLGRVIGGMRGTGYERAFDPELVKMYVEQADQMGTQLAYVLFLDAQDAVEGGTLNARLLAEAAPEAARRLAALPEGERLGALRGMDWSGTDLRPYTIRMQAAEGRTLGRALLGFSTRETRLQIRQAVSTNLAVTGVACGLGLLVALLAARRFSRPIQAVAAAMQKVAGGDLEQELAVDRRDEIGVLARAFNVMTQGLRERERIGRTFARYVSDKVAKRVLQEEDELELHGELRQVTVLFMDIRGFTAVSEFLHPRQVVALLNDYFAIIVDIILRNDGMVNKFIGDSIMAIYGAPTAVDLPEFRAVLTAVEIQQAVGEYNFQRQREGKPLVNFGIGIHSGEAIAGNIGSAQRMEYTVIGRDVNLAQRIESSAREGQVLVSSVTRARVDHLAEMHAKEAVFMKGIVEPIQLFE
ncbi:MAG TPA: adenylate/guanylate cyclase domain-containing protein, partial [Myxococcota bacterium]|nr:adenylate/guanylate cyclase domain-containing protein [Myxococcota bacterium]